MKKIENYQGGLSAWIDDRPWMADGADRSGYPKYEDWRRLRDEGNPLTGKKLYISELADIFKVDRNAIYTWIKHDPKEVSDGSEDTTDN